MVSWASWRAHKQEWHCFSWYKTKSHHKKLADKRVKAKENVLQTAHCSSRVLTIMEDSRGQKFTGTQKTVKLINQCTLSWSRNLFGSEISVVPLGEYTPVYIQWSMIFWVPVVQSYRTPWDSDMSSSLENLCVHWMICVSYFRHLLYSYSLRLCNHRMVRWEGTLEVIQIQPPITQSEVCEGPCIVLPKKKSCKLLRVVQKFWWANKSRKLKVWWSPEKMISMDLAALLKQTHTKIWIFSKINFLGPKDMLMSSTSCYISFCYISAQKFVS